MADWLFQGHLSVKVRGSAKKMMSKQNYRVKPLPIVGEQVSVFETERSRRKTHDAGLSQQNSWRCPLKDMGIHSGQKQVCH